MNIDDIFNKTAIEEGASVNVLANDASHDSQNDIDVADDEYSHMLVFKIDMHSQGGHVPGCLLFTLDSYYEKLRQIVNAHSASDIKSYLSYTQNAYKKINPDLANLEICEGELDHNITDLHKAYDFVECPEDIIVMSNKSVIEYRDRFNDCTTPNTEYFTQFYIIFKCTLKDNMRKLLRMLYNIWEGVNKHKSWQNYHPELLVLYNDGKHWQSATNEVIDLRNINTVYSSRTYTKNLEDKYIFTYKDVFCHDKEKTSDVEFNRRLISQFKKMIDKRTISVDLRSYRHFRTR